MKETVMHRRDRRGHAGWLLLLALACLIPGVAAAAEGPGAYKARRFDVQAIPGSGNLTVSETITFEFQSGTFRKVWRDIPAARTDGIEFIEARMDGVPLPRGAGEGMVAVSGANRIKVQWNFVPTGPSVHTFQLRYIARGAFYRDAGSDVLRWRALPSEHRYVIDASRITFATPAARTLPIETQRVGSVSQSLAPAAVVIDASAIRANGWVLAELRYPAGTMTSVLPEWQQRRARAAALAPRWFTVAGAVLALGLLAAAGARQGYRRPPMPDQDTTMTSMPEPLPAAMAAVLVAKGRASGYQAIATLVDLAERGVLTIRELPRTLGVRQYEVAQVPGTHELDDHEQAALAIAFGDRAENVTLGKARGRLARGGRRFAAAVNADLMQRGLIDPARKAVRDRLTRLAAAMLIGSALAGVAAAALIPRFDAWPFLIPLAGLLAALVTGVMASASSPLSDQGIVEAGRWRGFRQHLKAIAREHEPRGPVTIDSRWIVYAIATGLATQWSRYLRRHPGLAPTWFVATPPGDGSFAAFVGSQAAVSAGHSGGAGAGAAGGGGSGAG